MFGCYPPYGYQPHAHTQVQTNPHGTLWTSSFPPPTGPDFAYWQALGNYYAAPYRHHGYYHGRSRMDSSAHNARLRDELSRRNAEIKDMGERIEALRAALRKNDDDGYYLYNLRQDCVRDIASLRCQLDRARQEASRSLLDYQGKAIQQEQEIQALRQQLRDRDLHDAARQRYRGVDVAAHHLSEPPVVLDMSDFEAVLQPFADRCHDVARLHSGDLGPLRVSHSPIPQLLPGSSSSSSPSEHALLMRCATVETILARALLDHIFVDAYQPAPVDDNDQFYYYDRYRHRRHHRRGLAFSAATYAAVVEKAVDDVLRTIHASRIDPGEAAHPSGTRHSGAAASSSSSPFVDDLRELFRNGIDIWAPVHAKAAQADCRLWASLNPKPGRWASDEDMRPVYGGRGRYERLHDFHHSRPSPPPPPVIVPLFPQIFLECAPPTGGRNNKHNNSGRRHELIFHGLALWSDQRAFVLAREEQEEQSRRLHSDGWYRHRHRRRRRSSSRPFAAYYYYDDEDEGNQADQEDHEALGGDDEDGHAHDPDFHPPRRNSTTPSDMATAGSTYLDSDTSSTFSTAGSIQSH